MAYRRKRSAYRPAARRRKVRRRALYRARRRARAKASRTTITRTTSVLVPDRYRTKLRYSAVIRSSSFDGVPTGYTFRLNSVYDPDYTGIGRQPYGFDQLSAFYNNYVVTGSAIRVVPLPAQDDQRRHIQLTVIPSADALPPYNSSPWAYREMPYNRTRAISLGTNLFFPSSIVKHYMPVHKLLGVSRARVLSEDDYSAVVNNNPAIPLFWHVIVNSFTNTMMGTVQADCEVTITYYVNFFNRASIPPS